MADFSLGAALKNVSNLDTSRAGAVEVIGLDHIHPDPNNFYSLDGIDALAANIQLAGLQQYPVVRPDPETPGEYVLISGHRRLAALRQLAGEDREKWGEVPCVVNRAAASPALQELWLICANSDTRKMTSAELSQQAERVEMLLYLLKEEGMEFPGRMRDQVAEACKVSASKLARLKVIREKLDPVWREDYQTGKINESVAYALAQLPPEHQQILHAARMDGRVDLYERSVKVFGERLAAIDALKCAQAGHKGECQHKAEKSRRALKVDSWRDSPCTSCCSACPDLARCGGACPLLADKTAAAKAAVKERRQKEKAEQEAAEDRAAAKITAYWARYRRAREMSGRSSEECCNALGTIYDWTPEEVTSSTLLPYGFHCTLDDAERYVKIADLLGVSLDYLLCRTDDPHGGWRPPEEG